MHRLSYILACGLIFNVYLLSSVVGTHRWRPETCAAPRSREEECENVYAVRVWLFVWIILSSMTTVKKYCSNVLILLKCIEWCVLVILYCTTFIMIYYLKVSLQSQFIWMPFNKSDSVFVKSILFQIKSHSCGTSDLVTSLNRQLDQFTFYWHMLITILEPNTCVYFPLQTGMHSGKCISES